MPPPSVTIQLTQDHNRVTITLDTAPNHQPRSIHLERTESQSPSTAVVHHHQAQAYSVAPKERAARRLQQDVPPNPFESDCQFATSQGEKNPTTFRTVYDTGSDANLISESNLEQLKCRDKIRPLKDSAPLVSLSNTNIECIGEIDLFRIGKKKLFRRNVERLNFLVVPSSNTAVTGPIIGGFSLNALGLLEKAHSKRRAFGAAFRKFENKSKVTEEVEASRRRYAERKAENERQLKEEICQSSDDDAARHAANPPSQPSVGKP